MMSDISVTRGPINMGKTYLKNVWPHGDLDIWPTEVKLPPPKLHFVAEVITGEVKYSP